MSVVVRRQRILIVNDDDDDDETVNSSSNFEDFDARISIPMTAVALVSGLPNIMCNVCVYYYPRRLSLCNYDMESNVETT